jgi:hypothetical protein
VLVPSRPHVISYHYLLCVCVCAVADGWETFVDSCVHDDDFEDPPAKDPDTPAVQQVDALTQCLQRVTNAAISGELSPWELAGREASVARPDRHASQCGRGVASGGSWYSCIETVPCFVVWEHSVEACLPFACTICGRIYYTHRTR